MHDLEQDIKINKNDLFTECEEHTTNYWYWSSKLAEKKNEVSKAKNYLDYITNQTRLKILTNSNKSNVSEVDRIELLALQKKEVKYKTLLKRAEAKAFREAKQLTVVTPLNKEKDPTTKDIESSIVLNKEFINAEDDLIDVQEEISNITSKYHSTKDLTAKDIDTMVSLDSKIKELIDELNKLKRQEITYASALDCMANKKKMLDNLTTMFVRDYFAQAKPDSDVVKNKKNRPRFK